MLKTLVDVGVPLASKLKFISWNVNSLRAREPLVQKIIEKENPDILCIQELKINNSEYVSNFFKQHNYQTLSQTQKSYNGVSISLKQNIKFDEVNLLKLNEAQARNNRQASSDFSASIPGSALPSSHSRKAPPAVEMKVKSVAAPA